MRGFGLLRMLTKLKYFKVGTIASATVVSAAVIGGGIYYHIHTNQIVAANKAKTELAEKVAKEKALAKAKAIEKAKEEAEEKAKESKSAALTDETFTGFRALGGR